MAGPAAVPGVDPSRVNTPDELAASLDGLRRRRGLSYEAMEKAAALRGETLLETLRRPEMLGQLTPGSRRGVTEFLAQDGGVDLEFLRDLLREFVAHDAAGDALDVRQQIVHCLLLALTAAHWKLRPRPLD